MQVKMWALHRSVQTRVLFFFSTAFLTVSVTIFCFHGTTSQILRSHRPFHSEPIIDSDLLSQFKKSIYICSVFPVTNFVFY